MKKLLFPLLFSIFYLLSSNVVFSQDENYDAVYLHLKKEYTLNADGSMDYNYVKELKLQTYRSFFSLYGETFVVYNPGFQSLKINDVYTIMADGKKVKSPANAFNEVLPGFAANAPFYNNLREMVITHPGTERGAILNIDYTLHSKKGFYPALMGNELLAEYEPVKELIIRVRIPASMKLNYSLINTKATPIETNEAGFRVYSWAFIDVPAISTEEFQKSGYDLYPRLIFSTPKDRESIYSGIFKRAASSEQRVANLNQSADKIKQENKDEIQVVLKLQEKVVNELRLWPVPLKYTGFTCREAMEIWKSNGGTLAEKAILLTTLLKTAGISAEPVLVIKKSLYDEKVGSLLDIEDIIVKAMPKESDVLFLSVSSLNSQNLIDGLPEKVLVSFNSEGKISLIEQKDGENKIELKATITVDDKKQIAGEVKISFTNNLDPWFTLLRDNTKGKSFFGGFSSSDLKELKVITTGPVESLIKYTVAKEKPFHKDTNFYYYSLPYATNGIDSWGIKLLPKSRLSPFEIPSQVEEDYEFSFALPEELKLFSEEQSDIKNKTGEFFFKLKKEGGNIVVSKHIKLWKRIIEPSEYADFKALIDRWNLEKYREVIFTE